MCPTMMPIHHKTQELYKLYCSSKCARRASKEKNHD